MHQHLTQLSLKGFRRHEDSTLEFGEGINLIYGQNGAGKTNTLEAIHYLCLGKSFLASNDRYAVREGDNFFDVGGTFATVHGETTNARVTYVPGQGKRVFVNSAPLEKLSDILGRFPLVIHSPDDHILTAGPPEERRRFVDSVLCQFRPTYTANLLRYRRALKQRNAALQSVKYRRARADTLDTWDHEVVTRGARVAAVRLEFVAEFERYLRAAYEKLAVIPETPSVTYVPGIRGAESAEQFAAAYTERIASLRDQEIDSGRTLVGPHRDEFRLALDGRELRRFASQGQHRTFGMSLKLAQYDYLRERCEATPVLLLDDAFAHLDPERQSAFARLFADEHFGQTLMTAASREPLAATLSAHVGTALNLIEVSEGRIVDYISDDLP